MVNAKDNHASNAVLLLDNIVPRFSKHYPCRLAYIKNWNQNNRQTIDWYDIQKELAVYKFTQLSSISHERNWYDR